MQKKLYIQPICAYVLTEGSVDVLDANIVIASGGGNYNTKEGNSDVNIPGYTGSGAKRSIFFDDSEVDEEDDENSSVLDDIASW